MIPKSYFLPTVKTDTPARPSNWHGANGKFTEHYFSKFYQENSLTKAARQIKTQEAKLQKIDFFNQEIQKIEDHKHVLLTLNVEKEKFDKIRKKVLKEKKLIENRVKTAAITIQKYIRGHLSRIHHDEEMAQLKKAKLGISVKVMKKYVGKCCIYLGDNIEHYAVIIQKYIRRYLARKMLKKLRIEDFAARKLIRFFRVVKNRSRFKKNLEKLILNKKLKEIKKKLKWIKFKLWWKVNKTQFKVIRIKMKSRKSTNLDMLNKSRRNSSGSNRRSRRSSSFMGINQETYFLEKISNQTNTLDPGFNEINFGKIEEPKLEEVLTLTFNINDFQSRENIEINNPETYVELNPSIHGTQEVISTHNDESEVSSNPQNFSETSEIQSVHTLAQENQESIESDAVPEEKPVKKPEKEIEKPIPSYRKPTIASAQWKKTPPSPPEGPKEIHPPPKHLLVWTKCRKAYKNQTKRYKHKEPLWKPPLSANSTIQRKLPKVAHKPYKIPEFLEPYTLFNPVETPDSPIKLNQDDANDDSYSVDSDTSYEYEPAEYRSTGLNIALPQLYSIVKSYGKNADAIVSYSKRYNKPGI
jgi:IQ calmodulin-binding motif